ncbi:DNA-3-methyladenine glycosylase family protein [Paenibacillus polymyxa]|uniref:DNA-3-methyladenine glycosylase family protein n=1 Tax=Paenibacillus polymyxa TaxID=1406 RepID=UPI0008462026|nr:DNA-3-methyladenine glycosylase [Paenibacillus polymyxa]AOK91354.1 DNA-3-methyladenine glycosidase [Paenibacillus polymyxa]
MPYVNYKTTVLEVKSIYKNKLVKNDFVNQVIYNENVLLLSSSDSRLEKLIYLIGNLELNSDKDYFTALATSIIGQQLSSKAATTIRKRVSLLCNGVITPESIISIPYDDLRAAGLSKAKTEYIKDLAEKVYTKKIDFNEICLKEDNEIISSLTEVKGIGKWTTEMFLIFALNRVNVMSYADAGLQRAARWLYNSPEIPKYNYLQKVESSWEPFKSIASLYLWESIDRGYVDSGNSLDELFLKKIQTKEPPIN